MSDKNKGTKPSAYTEATFLLTGYIKRCKKYPDPCKALAIHRIYNAMGDLKEVIGDIELSFRRGEHKD
jgi:hypothetical protein